MTPTTLRDRLAHLRLWGIAVACVALVLAGFGWYWSIEPATFDPRERALARVGGDETRLVPGVVTTVALIEITETLLDKPGGYLLNDMFPPVTPYLMDNMPRWEQGVLMNVRDALEALRNDFSRSSVQTRADVNLERAASLFNIPEHYWIFPAAEDEYRTGIDHLKQYLDRLGDADATDAQFFTRADNLNQWLGRVATRLGSLTQQLSAAVGEQVVDTTLAGDVAAEQATPTERQVQMRTPWVRIDDYFYVARGSSWALLHLLRAVAVDFAPVLEQRNANATLAQLIRELEGTQSPMGSPMILNGSGFGIFANHSLVMAAHIARANSSLLVLRKQLERG